MISRRWDAEDLSVRWVSVRSSAGTFVIRSGDDWTQGLSTPNQMTADEEQDMKRTLTTVAKWYLVLALWSLVMVAASFTAIALIDASALLVDAGATIRSGLAMGIAVLVASLAAGTVWIKLRSTATSSPTEQQPLEALRSLRA
jgi:hypothetical protein